MKLGNLNKEEQTCEWAMWSRNASRMPGETSKPGQHTDHESQAPCKPGAPMQPCRRALGRNSTSHFMTLHLLECLSSWCHFAGEKSKVTRDQVTDRTEPNFRPSSVQFPSWCSFRHTDLLPAPFCGWSLHLSPSCTVQPPQHTVTWHLIK